MKDTKTNSFLFGLIFCFLLLSGCSYKKSDISIPSYKNNLSSLSGTYRSIQGVMDNLSCYCFNSGYLTLENGKSVAVCIEDEKKSILCDKVVIEGEYKTKKIDFEETSPCKDGEITYFNAISYKCN